MMEKDRLGMNWECASIYYSDVYTMGIGFHMLLKEQKHADGEREGRYKERGRQCGEKQPKIWNRQKKVRKFSNI